MELQRVCYRCLLREMPEQEYFQSMYQYIEQLEEEIKTEKEEYETRLMICKQCNHLLNGMCRICGCFVEMRAIITKNYCPDIERKW